MMRLTISKWYRAFLIASVFAVTACTEPTTSEGSGTSGGQTGGGSGGPPGGGGGGSSGSTTGSVSTRGGVVQVALQGGVFAVGPDTVAVSPPPRYQLPYGAIGFTARLSQPGGTLTVAVTFPSPLPSGARVLKRIANDWQDITSQVTVGTSTVSLAIADGGPWDADGSRNGEVRDPLAIGVLVPAQVSVDRQFTVFVSDTLKAYREESAVTPTHVIGGGGIYEANWSEGTARLVGFLPTIPGQFRDGVGNTFPGIRLSPSGRYALFRGADGQIRILRLARGESVREVAGAQSALCLNAFAWTEGASADTAVLVCRGATFRITPTGVETLPAVEGVLGGVEYDGEFPTLVWATTSFPCEGAPSLTCYNSIYSVRLSRSDLQGRYTYREVLQGSTRDQSPCLGAESQGCVKIGFGSKTYSMILFKEFGLSAEEFCVVFSVGGPGTRGCDVRGLGVFYSDPPPGCYPGDCPRPVLRGTEIAWQNREWWFTGAVRQPRQTWQLVFADPITPGARTQLPVFDNRGTPWNGNPYQPRFVRNPMARVSRGAVVVPNFLDGGVYALRLEGDALRARVAVYAGDVGQSSYGDLTARPVGEGALWFRGGVGLLLRPEGSGTVVRYLGNANRGVAIDERGRLWFATGGPGDNNRLHVFDPGTNLVRSSTDRGDFEEVTLMAASASARRVALIGGRYGTTNLTFDLLCRSNNFELWDAESLSRIATAALPTVKSYGSCGPTYTALKMSLDGSRLLGVEYCRSSSGCDRKKEAVHVFTPTGETVASVVYPSYVPVLWAADLSADGQRVVLLLYDQEFQGARPVLVVMRIDGSSERSVAVDRVYLMTLRGLSIEKVIPINGQPGHAYYPFGDVALTSNGEFALIGTSPGIFGEPPTNADLSNWAPQVVDLVTGQVVWEGPKLNRAPYLSALPGRGGTFGMLAVRGTRLEAELWRMSVR